LHPSTRRGKIGGLVQTFPNCRQPELCFALENLATGEMLGVIPQGVHLSFDEAKREIGL
jgi:hypothetical protein